jgi:hypothetical protein
MPREIVTSENRDDYIAKKLGTKSEDLIEVGGRKIPVNQHASDERSGNQLHFVDADKFDEGFKRNKDQYIGKGGSGNSISDRYKKVGEFLKTAPSMRVGDAHVRENGLVDFGDGRHRFAYLRDQGLKHIPMSFSKEAARNARKHGYLSNNKDDDKKK